MPLEAGGSCRELSACDLEVAVFERVVAEDADDNLRPLLLLLRVTRDAIIEQKLIQCRERYLAAALHVKKCFTSSAGVRE